MGTTPTAAPAAPAAPAAQAEQLAYREEHALIGSRAIRFITDRVNPPAALYVTSDDGLYVLVSSVAAGAILNLTATMLLPDGRVQPNSWQIAPPSTGAQTAYLFPLSEGFLLNVSVQPASGVRYGQTYMFACIRRGGMASGVNLQTLIASYCDSFGGPTWPGAALKHSTEGAGLLLSQYTGSVAAGAQFNWTVPSFARVRLRCISVSLATGAAVANRIMTFNVFDPSANPAYTEIVEPTQAANLTYWYNWGLKLGTLQTAIALNAITRSLPDVVWPAGFIINLAALNMQAADQFQRINMNWEQWFSF